MLWQIALAAFFWKVLDAATGETIRVLLSMVFWGLILSVVTTPFIGARRLMNARYAITDRRAIVVTGIQRPSHTVSIDHKATSPRRLPERWGETVMVGLRARARTSIQNWLWFLGDGASGRGTVMFQRLDSMDSPLDLLKQLHQPGGMPFALRALTVMGTKL